MNRIDYSPLYQQLEGSPFASWISDLRRFVNSNIEDSNDGHLPTWLAALNALPKFDCERSDICEGVRFDGDCNVPAAESALRQFHPWRKGPLKLGEVEIDTEWRSDWKWDRLKGHIEPLEGRTVLDIGCGNGYYLWRMLGAGAKLAVGIDPYLLFVMQFWATKQFAPQKLPAWVLPMGWEDLPPELPFFDTVFSMGVLYHRRNPDQFLQQLKNYVRPGGELVLETLVIEGNEGEVLVPQGRYAKMRNVWYIPSVSTLEAALKDAGWLNVRCIDVTPTKPEEQRTTDWMTFESLKDFLDPKDPTRTVEGYPAPIRAVIVANKEPRS